MRILGLFFVTFMMVISPFTVTVSYAQSQTEKVMAVFLFKFIDYVSWGDGVQTTRIICTYPQMAFNNLLEEISALRTEEYNIYNPASHEQLSQCHLIFLKDGRVPDLIRNHAVLTVSHSKDFAKQGGMIEMRKTPEKIDLIINLKSVRARNLSISSRLLDVATVIR